MYSVVTIEHQPFWFKLYLTVYTTSWEWDCR